MDKKEFIYTLAYYAPKPEDLQNTYANSLPMVDVVLLLYKIIPLLARLGKTQCLFSKYGFDNEDWEDSHYTIFEVFTLAGYQVEKVTGKGISISWKQSSPNSTEALNDENV